MLKALNAAFAALVITLGALVLAPANAAIFAADADSGAVEPASAPVAFS